MVPKLGRLGLAPDAVTHIGIDVLGKLERFGVEQLYDAPALGVSVTMANVCTRSIWDIAPFNICQHIITYY